MPLCHNTTPLNFSDETNDSDDGTSSKIHVKLYDDDTEAITFDVNVVTPEFLKKVFHLPTLPEYFTSLSDGEAIPISKHWFKLDESYVLNHSGIGLAINASISDRINKEGNIFCLNS